MPDDLPGKPSRTIGMRTTQSWQVKIWMYSSSVDGLSMHEKRVSNERNESLRTKARKLELDQIK
jgi:hypothetical protein